MSRITDHVDRALDETIDLPEASGGMVAASGIEAVEAAIAVLRSGGNAVDAAVTGSLVQGALDPAKGGLGGDAAVLVWRQEARTLHGLDGRGPGRSATASERSVPRIPGALSAHDALLARHGTRSLGAALEPSVRLARHAGRLELAATLERIAKDGPGVLYGGALGEAIAATTAVAGGPALEDLARHRAEWVDPIEGSYRGHPVFTLPGGPVGAVLFEALGVLEHLPLGDMDEVERAHVLVEALAPALASLDGETGGAGRPASGASRLDPGRLAERAAHIGPRASTRARGVGGPAAGACVVVVDAAGDTCTVVTGLGGPVGAQVSVPGTGIRLPSQEADVTGLLPLAMFRWGMPWLTFGVTAGLDAAQVAAQLLVRLVDLHTELPGAVDAPRLRLDTEGAVRLEAGSSEDVVRGLEARGHACLGEAFGKAFGAVHAVLIDGDTGERLGAADRRTDGRTEGT